MKKENENKIKESINKGIEEYKKKIEDEKKNAVKNNDNIILNNEQINRESNEFKTTIVDITKKYNKEMNEKYSKLLEKKMVK